MKTKKLLSVLLALTMVFSMMATLGITASAKPATDQSIKVGETQVIRAEGIYSSETTDGNYYYISVVDGSTQSVPMNNISIESVDQDGNEMVITIKGVAVTDEELVDIVAKVYREDESDWVDVAIQCAYHVVPADDAEYLDLDENTTEILEKKELDQNYNLTVNEGTKTDVIKVKLSWEIKDINATRTDNKVWNTTELCWETSSSSTTINQQGTAKFTLENYSSVMIDATASFKAEGNFKGTASYDVEGGKVTLDTADGNDTYSKTNVPTKVINATVTTAANDFDDKEATTKATKYGTYTVTISKYLPTSFVFSGFYDEEANNAKINGMTTSAFCQYMVDNGMIDSASEFGDVLVKYTYYNRFTKTNATGSRAMSLLVGTEYQEYVEGADVSATLLGDNNYPKDKSYNRYFNGTFTWDGTSFNQVTQQ